MHFTTGMHAPNDPIRGGRLDHGMQGLETAHKHTNARGAPTPSNYSERGATCQHWEHTGGRTTDMSTAKALIYWILSTDESSDEAGR